MTVQPTRDQLRALADQASRGPWEVDDGGGYDYSVTQDNYGDYVACDVAPRDAAFIAAARTAVPHLLDQLDAAEQHIRDLAQEVRDERGAARDQMEQVRIRDARIKAVRELHSESRIIPDTPVFGCAECGEPNETEPCATIRALEG